MKAGGLRLARDLTFTDGRSSPQQNSWQLTRKTADLLLQMGSGSDGHADADPLSPPACGSAGSSFDLLLGDVHSLKQNSAPPSAR